MNNDHKAAHSAQEAATRSRLGEYNLALGLLCGLHPEITRDEPAEVAQQIFDHVQAERAEHQRELTSARQTIDLLLNQSATRSSASTGAASFPHALRVALEDLDALEPLGPTTEAVIDAAQKWYLAKPTTQPIKLAPLTNDDLRAIAHEVGMKSSHDGVTMRSVGHAGGMTAEDGFAFARAAISKATGGAT